MFRKLFIKLIDEDHVIELSSHNIVDSTGQGHEISRQRGKVVGELKTS